MREMKKILLILFCFIVSRDSYSQNHFEEKKNKLLGFIERTFNIENTDNDEKTFDFFVYDISIEDNGDISEIHMLIMDSLYCLFQASQISDNLKNKFSFKKSAYNKLLIPVLIIYTSGDEASEKNKIKIFETIKVFETFSKCNLKDTYITRTVLLNRLTNSRN